MNNCIRCGNPFPPHTHTGRIPFETRYCETCIEIRVKERASQGFDNAPIVAKTKEVPEVLWHGWTWQEREKFLAANYMPIGWSAHEWRKLPREIQARLEVQS